MKVFKFANINCAALLRNSDVKSALSFEIAMQQLIIFICQTNNQKKVLANPFTLLQSFMSCLPLRYLYSVLKLTYVHNESDFACTDTHAACVSLWNQFSYVSYLKFFCFLQPTHVVSSLHTNASVKVPVFIPRPYRLNGIFRRFQSEVWTFSQSTVFTENHIVAT